MHRVFALLCFAVVIHRLIFPYPSGLLHWHCGNLTIAPVPAKQPWWIWINTSCEFIMDDCITTTKQSKAQQTVCISWDILYVPTSMCNRHPKYEILQRTKHLSYKKISKDVLSIILFHLMCSIMLNQLRQVILILSKGDINPQLATLFPER